MWVKKVFFVALVAGFALNAIVQHQQYEGAFTDDTQSVDGNTAQVKGNTVFILDGDGVTATLTHPSKVFTARFAPNSRMVVTTAADDKVRIWDFYSGKLLNEFSPLQDYSQNNATLRCARFLYDDPENPPYKIAMEIYIEPVVGGIGGQYSEVQILDIRNGSTTHVGKFMTLPCDPSLPKITTGPVNLKPASLSDAGAPVSRVKGASAGKAPQSPKRSAETMPYLEQTPSKNPYAPAGASPRQRVKRPDPDEMIAEAEIKP